MKKMPALLTTLLLSITNYAHAIPFHFEDNIFYTKDVVFAHFTLTETRDVSFWTDSCLYGVNFDPNIALWDANGSKLHANDDDNTISPDTQTFGDSGLKISALAAGEYIVTLAMFNNWSVSDHLSDGFLFDYDAKMTLSDWNMEFGTSSGAAWSLWLSGVEDAYVAPSNSVPEPVSLALFLTGLIALGVKRKRHHS